MRVAELPSIGGSSDTVSAKDNMKFIPEKRPLPRLDQEEQDIILLTHSYSTIPGSAAAEGLAKAERRLSRKQTGIIAQIHITGFLIKGGGSPGETSPFGPRSGL